MNLKGIMNLKNFRLGECDECSKDEDIVERGGNIDFINYINGLCIDCNIKLRYT